MSHSKRRMKNCGTRDAEAGQSLVFFAFLFVALLGFLVLVTDVGFMYYTKRDLQGAVDAATMAGSHWTPTSVDTSAQKLEAINRVTHEALGCYARNMGISASSVPAPNYTFTPAWDGGNGTNYRYSTTVGGDVITVTVLYQDAETQVREIPKELCVRVDARRNARTFFAGVIGFSQVDLPAAAAGYRGIFRVTWAYRTGADVHATPLHFVDSHAGNQQVTLIGSKDGSFYCLNAMGRPNTKKTDALWKYQPNRPPNNNQSSDNLGGTRTLNPPEVTATGDDESRNVFILSPCAAVDTGSRSVTLFTICDGADSTRWGALYALDISTGQRLWSRDIRNAKYHLGSYGETYIDSTPVPSSDKSVVYVGSRGGYLYAFHMSDGSNVPNVSGGWQSGRVQLFGGTISTPVVEPRPGDSVAATNGLEGRSDIIYMSCSRPKDSMGSGGSTQSGYVYAFYSNGKVKWSWRPSGNNDGFDSSPTILGNTLYIGCRNNNIYALNKETGALKWNYTAEAQVSSTPAVETVGGNTYVYFASENGKAYKIQDNGSTASLVWKVLLGLKDPNPNQYAAWHISPAISAGYVYFGIQTRSGGGPEGRGYFEAVNKATGSSDQQYMLGADVHSNMRVASNNWLYFASCDNLIYGVNLDPAKQESKLIW